MPNITPLSWLIIALLAFIWGGAFLVTEIALTQMPPFWIAALRVGLAAALMITVWRVQGFRLFLTAPKPSDFVALIFIGMTSSAVPFTLLAWGQQYVTSGFAGVSMAATGLIILPLAHFFVAGERMTLPKSIGFALGFAGVVILIGPQAFDTTGNKLETLGRLATLGAALCYALSSIVMRRLPAIDPIGLATVLLLVATCISFPVAFAVEGPPPLPSSKIIVALGFLGLVPTAAANMLRVIVVRSAGPVFMSLVNYQVPVWAVLLGSLILNEPLPPSLAWSLVLILGGVALSQYRVIATLFGRGAR
ncbi:MAG: DMT family transporter [Sulfitobacter sp.]